MVMTSYTVQLHTKPNISMVIWCDKNCEGLWFGTKTTIFWTFALELDAMAFKLTWT